MWGKLKGYTSTTQLEKATSTIQNYNKTNTTLLITWLYVGKTIRIQALHYSKLHDLWGKYKATNTTQNYITCRGNFKDTSTPTNYITCEENYRDTSTTLLKSTLHLGKNMRLQGLHYSKRHDLSGNYKATGTTLLKSGISGENYKATSTTLLKTT